jgi:hypothetical protein
MKLAKLASSAVNLSKTGRPVDMTQLPKCRRWRPDFFAPASNLKILHKYEIELEQYDMDDDDKTGEEGDDTPRWRYYKSKKNLGDLYRAVDEEKIWAKKY